MQNILRDFQEISTKKQKEEIGLSAEFFADFSSKRRSLF
jgi:hypothetical protein